MDRVEITTVSTGWTEAWDFDRCTNPPAVDTMLGCGMTDAEVFALTMGGEAEWTNGHRRVRIIRDVGGDGR